MNVDTEENTAIRKKESVQMDRALQESWEHYENCFYRTRNMVKL
jgi:hypothetical protein